MYKNNIKKEDIVMKNLLKKIFFLITLSILLIGCAPDNNLDAIVFEHFLLPKVDKDTISVAVSSEGAIGGRFDIDTNSRLYSGTNFIGVQFKNTLKTLEGNKGFDAGKVNRWTLDKIIVNYILPDEESRIYAKGDNVKKWENIQHARGDVLEPGATVAEGFDLFTMEQILDMLEGLKGESNYLGHVILEVYGEGHLNDGTTLNTNTLKFTVTVRQTTIVIETNN